MSCHAEAQQAIDEQGKLNRVGTDIYVNFSSKFREIKLPEPGSMYDDFTHAEVKDMFIDRGFTVKESKECGAGGSMALLTMASPEEALRALAVMHNYAPEEYKFKNAAGLCVSFSSARKQQ